MQELAALVRFEYQSPYQSFQRSTVCGKLCTLFRIKDPQKFAVSLKEVIGGRVANVVVEKSQTASEILKAKVLRERVTFMPIDKMQVRSVDPDKLRQIHQLTGGAAKLAIELIEFDRKYEPVMVQVSETCTCYLVSNQYQGHPRTRVSSVALAECSSRARSL